MQDDPLAKFISRSDALVALLQKIDIILEGVVAGQKRGGFVDDPQTTLLAGISAEVDKALRDMGEK